MSSKETLSILTLVALLAGTGNACSQSFTIDWRSIAGGGGTSAGGSFALSGTIGQNDATLQPLAGGSYSLTGGFWSRSAVQAIGAPRLDIRLHPQQPLAMISWPSSATGFILQQSTEPSRSSWTTVSQAISDDGTNRFILINPPLGHRFYRLFKP